MCRAYHRSNERVSEVHNRMPVLLTVDGIREWLDVSLPAPLHLAQGIPSESVVYHPVSTDVNNARNHGEHLMDVISLGGEISETLF